MTYSSDQNGVSSNNCSCKEVLIVDDDDFNRCTFQSVLETLGIESMLAANGQEALDLVKT